nr:ribosomal protein S4 [Ostreobium quekettii]
MSRYKGPRLKITRRLGELPGLTGKKSIRQTANLKKKSSQYGIRLETKQKLRYHYGITEKKLIQYVQKARRLKGSTGEILLQLLDKMMRLDNILFRVGFAPTISAARQLISHGHILINNSKINIPSYSCQLNDQILIRKKTGSSNWLKNLLRKVGNKNLIPSHLKVNPEELKVDILDNIQYSEVGLNLNELLIIEYYSRS